MKILIDNGHGSETPGKRSPDGELREYKWNRDVGGWSIYTTKGITLADQLAESIWNAANRTFKEPLTTRSYSTSPLGHDFEAEFYILMHTYCPAVLIENFFMDNKQDCAYLQTDEGKATCAEVAIEGIKAFMAAQ